MRRKRLNHYADVMCKMFVGWRMGDDLEVLSDLPDGTIYVDLLTGSATHSVAGNLDLHIAKELQAWLRHESEKDNIDFTQLMSGGLEIDINTGKISTNRKKVVSFNFDCRSSITTDEATYTAHVKDMHQWYSRVAT
ncbi:hypothetical protein [Simiduia agarivorans]|uniref:Uncharacterized protein n=1 Tax=Simiduia agarivorans (strain DSM 21679 / JCM 13881 / BCRC 17597 / SA1) TaxID=1117647 RepID=K4KNV1_SIMAS|nr:hypothetical protein [Simiduia agarivorans]AFU99915.1 hypothetical protein M5M_13885 [Simiduia agarivorans SA1 = DSM 21679]AFU99920.1 hypothetical protein M5M_13910 [Simiduia agarivorans SA1 = DSM 21679]